jgi:hypothetical protein
MSPPGKVKTIKPISTAFIGRSRSVSTTTLATPARVAASPLRTPESNELRSEISVHTPPTSMAPTPR